MLNSLIAVLSTSYIAWYFQNHEHAVVYPFDATYATPEQAGAAGLTEHFFTTDDGARLVVWQAVARDGYPTILYFQGNAGTLQDRAARLLTFAELGYGIVAPAYRGSSGSTGAPDEALLVADAIAIADDLEGPVVLYGESLGAAVAIQLAAKGVGQAIVLEAPFTSLVDLIAAQYPMEDLDDTITQRWESLMAIDAVTQPMMVIHGEDDRLVPVSMGQAIFEAAGSSDKTFLTVAEGGHTELWTANVQTTLFDFLSRTALP
ncbi:MAG: alpha/beta hydrolase [Paracoccaceae bacterium]